MIVAGEDPRFVARRLVILSSEDVGLADPNALVVTEAAAAALDRVGLPEAALNLAEAVVYLASAPKSNRVAVAIWNAMGDVERDPLATVPPRLRGTGFQGAKALGHGVGYQYPHDDPRGFVDQTYLPDELAGRRYYEPSEHGFEREVAERLAALVEAPKTRRGQDGLGHGERMTMDGDGLRVAFTRYFVERDHTALPAASLVPVDPTVMFTIAGMVQFKPYFTGEQTPPVPRATTIQPCFRTNDLEIVGTTARHTTLFEMLGNFSFGDYFKELAIPLAWVFVTEVLGFDPDRLWITVHESDDDASGIWQDAAQVPAERIQKMGAENFWEMGEVGPCGPCSEIYFDRGEHLGPGGGPANDDSDRYSEIWNLVFMQFDRAADGTMADLPKKNIDTGAGFERILMLLQGVDSVFATDASRRSSIRPRRRRGRRWVRPTTATSRCASSPTTRVRPPS